MTRSTNSESALFRKKATSLALVAAVPTAVLIVSFLPQEDKQLLHSHGRYHSWGHLIVFSVLGYVAARAASSRRTRIIAFCAAVLFGTAIEFAEHLLYQSPLERKDILVDALGVIVGTLLANLSASRK